MGLLTFSGGIHPYEGKDLTKDKPVREYLPKGECVYPLKLLIGAPVVPIVIVVVVVAVVAVVVVKKKK